MEIAQEFKPSELAVVSSRECGNLLTELYMR